MWGNVETYICSCYLKKFFVIGDVDNLDVDLRV
jgi:hypothetical protein